MKVFLLLCLISSLTTLKAQDIPSEWISYQKDEVTKGLPFVKTSHSANLSSTGNEKLQSLIGVHHNLAQRLGQKMSTLDRIDMSLGISASGQIGLFTAGTSQSIEYIWKKRKSSEADSKELIIEVHPDHSEKEIADYMLKSLKQTIDFSGISNSIQRSIVRTLYQDAKKIAHAIEQVSFLSVESNWKLNTLRKNYYFSSSIGFNDSLSLGYDKRIRFRFRVNMNSTEKQIEKNLSFGGQHKQKFLTQTLANAEALYQTSQKLGQAQFAIDRIRVLFEVNAELNLLFFTQSLGRGILFEFTRQNLGRQQVTDPNLKFVNKASQIIKSMAPIYQNKTYNHENNIMELDQVRFSFQVNKAFDIKLVTIESAANIELHLRKQKQKSQKISPIVRSAPSLTLKQVDYRNRLNFTFGLPLVNRVRIRPSLEQRYKK